MDTKLKGRMMLNVTGILYIILSSLRIIGTLLSLIGSWMLILSMIGADFLFLMPLFLSAFVQICLGVLGLVSGVLGVKWCARADKAHPLFVLGIVLVALSALPLILAIVTESGADVTVSTLGLVLPILYAVGAYQNKQSA